MKKRSHQPNRVDDVQVFGFVLFLEHAQVSGQIGGIWFQAQIVVDSVFLLDLGSFAGVVEVVNAPTGDRRADVGRILVGCRL